MYPEGVASGDPESDSVLLWTRHPPFEGRSAESVTVELAEDGRFRRVIATAEAPVDTLRRL
jgi:alkaline phosphatase D